MSLLRACFKNTRGSAARDFGRSLGGEAGQSPQRAWRAEPTTAAAKSTAARRVFAPKALWLRCASVTARLGGCSLGAPRQRAFGAKKEPLVFFRHALRFTGHHSVVHSRNRTRFTFALSYLRLSASIC